MNQRSNKNNMSYMGDTDMDNVLKTKESCPEWDFILKFGFRNLPYSNWSAHGKTMNLLEVYTYITFVFRRHGNSNNDKAISWKRIRAKHIGMTRTNEYLSNAEKGKIAGLVQYSIVHNILFGIMSHFFGGSARGQINVIPDI